jgi:hypothetical protein
MWFRDRSFRARSISNEMSTKRFVLGALFTVLLGCDAQVNTEDLDLDGAIGSRHLPEWIEDPRAASHPDFPPDRYICAIAQSPDGVDVATELARASVSERIRSQIESSLDQKMNRVTRNGETIETLEATLEIHQISDFSRADLIRPAGESVDHKGETFQMTCLDRGEAIQVLQLDNRAALADLDQRIKEAELTQTGNRDSEFTLAFMRMNIAWAQVEEVILDLSALRGASEPIERKAELVRHASTVRARQFVGVHLSLQAGEQVPPTEEEALKLALSEALTQAAAELDVQFLEEGRCGTAKVSGELHIAGSSSCSWGSSGWRCELPLERAAQSCAEAGEAGKKVGGEKLSARDGSRVEAALRSLIGKLRGDRIGPALSRVLSSATPVLVREP